ncbi:MAG: glycine cleavage system aminomethyltransferase GcvT [Hyphomonadaceae bacterium]
MADIETTDLKRTALYDLHVAHGGKIVPFAGYEMPVQFEGVKVEHLWTREKAGLFDVSHMGPCFLTLDDTSLTGDEAHKAISKIMEELVPSSIRVLKRGKGRLTVLLNEDGGILDDLIITRPELEELQGTLYIVVNGAVKDQDWALFEEKFAGRATLHRHDHRVLFALQGPQAVDVLKSYFRGCEDMTFMESRHMFWKEARCAVTRCGYTGEDGFEVLVDAEPGRALVEALLTHSRVKPIGLGARDSLRLEAGLCLYGHDMDANRTPVEADLQWVIQKSRRTRADFPGAAKILDQYTNGAAEKRVGIQPLGRAPAREGVEIQIDGTRIGTVTSGGFGPSVEKPVAMGYVASAHTEPGTKIDLIIRGKAHPAEIAALPFVQPNYKR